MTNNIDTLADLYAVAKAEMDACAKRVEELRKEILNTGHEKINGANFAVEVGLSERTTIDTKLVRQFLTNEELASCSKTAVVTTLRIKVSEKVAAA